MMKFALIAALAVLVFAQLAAASCHNATGSCTSEHFVCANEEMVPHAKRCDGVEDCADGTDEYMCDQRADRPLVDMTESERNAVTEASCIYCTCYKGQITVSSGAWLKIGLTSPRDMTMLTDAPTKQNKACYSSCTNSVLLNVYKKKNKGCRGWVCCFRQQSCVTCATSGGPCVGTCTTATHCWP